MLAGISCWYSVLVFLMWCPLSFFLPFLTAFGQSLRKKNCLYLKRNTVYSAYGIYRSSEILLGGVLQISGLSPSGMVLIC